MPVSASVAADSGLLPKASASSEERGSSASSATLPGPAEEYSQVIAPLRAKSCQPSLVAHVAGARASERVALRACHRRKRQRERPLLRAQAPGGRRNRHLGVVVHAGAAQMGREQRVRPQHLIAAEHHIDEQRIALHRGHDAQRELEALVAMDHSHGWDARRHELDRVLP